MKYLIDTVIWLWSIDSVDKMNATCRRILEDGLEEIYFSAATAWELSIKARLGKLRLPGSPAQCIPAFMARQGLRPLPVTHLHAVAVYDLPPHHRDPFDRLIIAQATVEGLTVMTSDRAFQKYSVDVLWCGK
ncbi:MAG: type II toxin-antitoxin system VapC family toxin [Candidatus Sulfotelmatobacter sp.]